jgi:acyl-homoserine lactone acylase PvdQ
VRSWSVAPFGQSDNPASPHYADQAEKLFSPGRLKPTWFDPAELAGNVESTLVLQR